MHRFFEFESPEKGRFKISKENYEHMHKSLRIRDDEEFEVVFDGTVYSCKIDGHFAKIVSERAPSNESRFNLRLFQGLSKGSKHEEILNSCTQAGVSSFVFVETERSVSKLKDDFEKKRSRYERIMLEAACQSKRDKVPELIGGIKFAEIEKFILEGITLIAYEDEKTLNICEALKGFNGENVNLIIGPEGGFSEEEVEKIKSLGAKSVSLGRLILRTETAALAASYYTLARLEEEHCTDEV